MTSRLATPQFEILKRIGSATLYEAQDQTGAFDACIKPIDAGMRLAGRAFTIDSVPGDNLALHHALTLAQPNDVLVIDAKGFLEAGYSGNLTALAAVTAGLAGFVIDGAVRDADATIALGFPVFARGLSIKVVTKNHIGRINGPIFCGGVKVNSGDIIVGDRDGIVAIAADTVDQVIVRALERERKEEFFSNEIRQGRTTAELIRASA
jgi:4-hydroxy-4-methyl-2-oxoglutarate aldolase